MQSGTETEETDNSPPLDPRSEGPLNFSEARHLHERALREYTEGRERKDLTLVREAYEKGWLAGVKAIDSFLIRMGFEVSEGKSEAHQQRRDALDVLIGMDHETFGMLKDYYRDLADELHGRGFYAARDLPHQSLLLRKLPEDIIVFLKRQTIKTLKKQISEFLRENYDIFRFIKYRFD